jgi:hypothetical protein
VNTNTELVDGVGNGGHLACKSQLGSSKHDFETLMTQKLKNAEAEEENSQARSEVHSDEQEIFQDWQEQFNSYLVSQQYVVQSHLEIIENKQNNILNNIFKQNQIVQMFKQQKSNPKYKRQSTK